MRKPMTTLTEVRQAVCDRVAKITGDVIDIEAMTSVAYKYNNLATAADNQERVLRTLLSQSATKSTTRQQVLSEIADELAAKRTTLRNCRDALRSGAYKFSTLITSDQAARIIMEEVDEALCEIEVKHG